MNSDSLRGEAMANIKSKLKLTKDKILGENHKNVVGLSRLLLSDWEFIPRLNLTKWVNIGYHTSTQPTLIFHVKPYRRNIINLSIIINSNFLPFSNIFISNNINDIFRKILNINRIGVIRMIKKRSKT